MRDCQLDTVVARDLSMDIKRLGDESRFVRTAPGRYTMREFLVNGLVKMGDSGLRPLALRHQNSSNGAAAPEAAPTPAVSTTPVLSSALRDGRQGVLSSHAAKSDERTQMHDVLEAALARQ